jgi:hypothetical protein
MPVLSLCYAHADTVMVLGAVNPRYKYKGWTHHWSCIEEGQRTNYFYITAIRPGKCRKTV